MIVARTASGDDLLVGGGEAGLVPLEHRGANEARVLLPLHERDADGVSSLARGPDFVEARVQACSSGQRPAEGSEEAVVSRRQTVMQATTSELRRGGADQLQ